MPGKRKISFVAVVAILYSGLFIYTGVVKLADPAAFRADLDGSPLASLSGLLVWIVPIFELILAGFLLVPSWWPRTIRLAVVLMAVFTLFFLFQVYAYPSAACGCGGFIERLDPLTHLLFNLGFIILGLLGISRSAQASKILRAQNSLPAAGKETPTAYKQMPANH